MNLFKSKNKVNGLGGAVGAKVKPQASNDSSGLVNVWSDRLKIFTVFATFPSSLCLRCPPLLPL